MREKQQAAREQERHRRRTIESYCQDALQRQEEFEHKVREQPLLWVRPVWVCSEASIAIAL